MFGADTPLVMDALQIAGLAAVTTGALVWFFLQRGKPPAQTRPNDADTTLESRVRVLERIATDRSVGLADEIEALRDAPEQGK